MEFSEIKPEDFTSFTPGKVAAYIEIEQLLSKIGGGGNDGTTYKKAAMKAAGWKYDGLTGYAKNPEMAAMAFNKIRVALMETQDKEEILTKVQA